MEGLGKSLLELCGIFTGPVQAGAQSFLKLEQKITAAMRGVMASTKNQIAGFDELHRIQTQAFALPKDPAEKRPSKGGSTVDKGASKALRAAAAALRQLTEELLPALWMGVQMALPGLLLLAAALSSAFSPLGGMLQGILLLLSPLAALLGELWQVLSAGWNELGAPVLAAIGEGLSGLWAIVTEFWNGTLVPIGAAFAAKMAEWQAFLAPFWQGLMDSLGGLGQLVADVWNGVILPVLDHARATLSVLVNWIAQLVLDVSDTVVRTAAGLMEALSMCFSGINDFIRGVFSADWKKAWNGVVDILSGVFTAAASAVRGAVNLVIDLLNALLRAVNFAVNCVASGVEKLGFTVPSWVPGIGGKQFAPKLPRMPEYQIPKLAQGAVLPANRPFLAMVGDQKNGTNVEAPLDTIKEALMEALHEMQAGELRVAAPIEVQLDGEVLYRAVNRVRASRGAQIGGAFGELY